MGIHDLRDEHRTYLLIYYRLSQEIPRDLLYRPRHVYQQLLDEYSFHIYQKYLPKGLEIVSVVPALSLAQKKSDDSVHREQSQNHFLSFFHSRYLKNKMMSSLIVYL